MAHTIGSAIFRRRADAKAEQAARDAEQATRNAKLKFAQDAVKPGAGLDYQPPAPPPVARATGGRTGQSKEQLVNRLINRWKAAKKATDATTKPLLSQPDAAIVRALNIAQEHI